MPLTEEEATPAPLRGEMARAILETLLETSDDAIFSKSLDNVIVSWSRGAERMYGYPASEIVGQPVTRLAPPALHAEMADIQKAVSEGRRVDTLETVRRTKDGNLINVRLTVSPAFNAAGRVIGAVTLARDITDRKKIEQSLRRMQSEAASRLLVMDTVNGVAVGILTSQTGVEALRHIAEAARALVGARYAALGVA
ncbi:MAG: PAS domain S-box protein, partial [Armatimonadota bacterium]|nr:PAS domain S-box protein [Armatimonadota bacterium]